MKNYTQSIFYFSEMLRQDVTYDRDILLSYAGMLLAFDDIFGSYGVGNQLQERGYDPNEPQYLTFVIYSETDPMPDTGCFINVYSSGKVIVKDIRSYPDPDTDERSIDCEEYETTMPELIKWLRTQPPKLHSFLGDLI